MARPIKEGLDYFPLDVDIDQDDKIALIEATHGLEGFGVIIKILMKIYDNSYYYEWGEKEQLLFSRRVNVNINKVNEVINDCIKWGIFSKQLHEDYQILSSAGIQRRYLEASSRRKQVSISTEYLLLDKKDINAYKNLIIVDNNSIDENISTQSKVKESKVKESKEVACSNPFDFYQENFGVINPFIAENIDQWTNDLSDDLVIESMKIALKQNKPFNYAEAILKNWKKKNISSLDAVRAAKKEFERSKKPEIAVDDDYDYGF